MSRYNIPNHVKSGFDSFISLDVADVDYLSSALKNSKVGDGVNIITKDLTDKLDLDEDTIRDIVVAIFSIVNIFYDSGETIETFSKDFVNSYVKKFQSLSEKDTETFQNHLLVVLPSLSTPKLTVKAVRLIRENANNFVSARIISDIRIVYDDNGELGKVNQNAIVVHHLKIKHFNETTPRGEIHISLDLSDLHSFQKIINRAIEKDGLIRKADYQLNFIDPE